MSAWFIRCNGETAHNQPGTARFVPGEPPRFPDREFNYVNECLNEGFARVGWPAAGDLRELQWRARATGVYGAMMKPHHVRYLERFVLIVVGDLVLLPTSARKRNEVHLGVVFQPRRPRLRGTGTAYYYYFDVQARDWYDNAHRVDVEWAKRADGRPRSFDVPEIGGTWIRGFGEVKAGRERVVRLARDSGLL